MLAWDGQGGGPGGSGDLACVWRPVPMPAVRVRLFDVLRREVGAHGVTAEGPDGATGAELLDRLAEAREAVGQALLRDPPVAERLYLERWRDGLAR